MKKTHKKKFQIPIYNVAIWLIISEEIEKEREKMNDVFGPIDLNLEYIALCSYNGPYFGIFIKPDSSIGTISHEIFHLTHRILDWKHANFDMDHQEQGAQLCEYLSELIWNQIRIFNDRT